MAKPLLFSCFSYSSRCRLVKLVFWGGATRFLAAREQHLAGELMLQFHGRVLCHADSFYIGLSPPVLSADDELLPGQTYFVLPADRFRRSQTLTTASLAASLAPSTQGKVTIAGNGQSPFAYVKGSDGRRLIKVLPEFIARVISSGECGGGSGGDGGSLCSTPELKKHYALLVRSSRDRPWSPKLETISESKRSRGAATKARLSPVRLLGLGLGRT
ncbi:hypothetical protein Cni_G12763 [Canna indica]|uniref:Uncharacterized protein n=1 Tax=Canna indica TaxID=4628 RepID=A0AAQ3K8E3_9LILI|nr:hypothetical protein Cni_G12763 [Canna indica]